MNTKLRFSKGFTLIEMIMVLVVMSSILLLITNYGSQRMNQFRRDKTALQMQEALSAALAYYLNNGAWPTAGTAAAPATLATSSLIPVYLPSVSGDMYPFATNNKMRNNKYLVWVTANNSFLVAAPMPSVTEANIVAGMLPGSAAMNDGTALPGGEYATAQVNIPGQNLNNARSVNFMGIYHHGACVPVPSCPGNMNAQIIVSPVSVSGVNDPPTTSDGVTLCNKTTSGGVTGNCASINAYPITSFQAYAIGPTVVSGASSGPANCNGSGTQSCILTTNGSNTFNTIGDNHSYWRVCLQVYTEKGPVSVGNASSSANDQHRYWNEALGSIAVSTRCVPPAEPAGSDYTAYWN